MSPLRVEGGPAEAKRRRVIPGTAPVKARGSITMGNKKEVLAGNITALPWFYL